MKRRGFFSLFFTAFIAPETVVNYTYRTKCPDCGLDFIAGGRMALAQTYLEHFTTDCPGVARPIRDPGSPA
jgi:hypothetical protein